MFHLLRRGSLDPSVRRVQPEDRNHVARPRGHEVTQTQTVQRSQVVSRGCGRQCARGMVAVCYVVVMLLARKRRVRVLCVLRGLG